MRDWTLAFLAAMGSAALLGAALFFEMVMGLEPCQLCIWQRWPHALAVVLGVMVWAWPNAGLILAGAASAAASGVLGLYHTGVERGIFDGPTACSGGVDMSRLNAEELLERILAAPVVRCDEVAWELLGLSMASWNALASFALAAVWLVALRRV